MKNKLYQILLIVGLGFFWQNASAQTWDEWFHQSWSLHQYDAQEIGGRWAFLERVSDGLQVVGKGLTTVINITNGELNLHRDFFGARQNVNPNINNAVDFIEVLYFQIAIVRQMNSTYARCSSDPHFTASELMCLERVHRNFLVLTEANIRELLKILQPSDMSMSDDERMDQLNRIYDDMKDQRAFVNAFNNETQMMSWERQHEINEVNRVRSQYEMF